MPESDLPRMPFNRPYVTGRELELMADAVAQAHLSGDGPFTRRANALLADITGSGHVMMTTSCTHALELCALLLDLEPGDEVIMPSFTFVSTANAFALRGAIPVFVDIRPDTFNIDERLVEAAITDRTKAIVVVHYGGVSCEMDEILALAADHGSTVVEDAAHALGGTYRGRRLASLGSLATLSFHATKNIQCGEGGALVVNDPRFSERAEILREKGTNRSRFLRGEVDKYTWVDVGSSYLPSDVLAAFLTAQLEAFEEIQRRRAAIWGAYEQALTPWSRRHGVLLSPNLPDRQHPAHLFALVLADVEERQRFIDHMAQAGIQSSFHYVPLHSSPAGGTWRTRSPLPVTEAVADGLTRLPLSAAMDEDDAARVIARALEFVPRRATRLGSAAPPLHGPPGIGDSRH